MALVATELAPVAERLTAELGVEMCFRDPEVAEFGLENALWTLGDTFLEVVSPVEDGTTAGRYLERRGGDCGYMVILQCDDLDADRARVTELGVRVVWQADLPGMRGTHLHPADVGGAILSLDAADPPSSWKWAGPDWQPTAAGEIVGVELGMEDPGKAAARWAEVLGREAQGDEVALERGIVRFVPAADRGEGLTAIDIARSPHEAGSIDVCGVRVNFG